MHVGKLLHLAVRGIREAIAVLAAASERVAPQAREAVEVALAGDVVHVVSLAPGDDDLRRD